MRNESASIGKQVHLVQHEAFKTALKYCLAADSTPPGSMTYVVGASGVGKTQLSKLIGKTLYGGLDGRTHPWVRVPLENSSGGFFTSTFLVRQMLSQLRDPFRGMDVLPPDLPADVAAHLGRALSFLGHRRSESEERMRQALASLARALQCRLLILDEANIMILIKRNRPIESHIESIRTLSLAMGVRTILFGTIAVLMFMGYSAQANRISFPVHFDRIRDDSSKGMLEFLSFLDGCERDIGLPEGLLAHNADALYDVTYGIPGELISLLERARAHSSVRGLKKPELRDLEKAYPSEGIKQRMREEADLVERVLAGGRLDSKDVTELLKERGRFVSAPK